MATSQIDPAWRDLAIEQMTLHGTLRDTDLLPGLVSADLERTIDGASTLTLGVQDARLILLRSGALNSRSWVTVDGLTYELVQVRKSGFALTLLFEDSIIAALRRRTGALNKKPNTTTRSEFVRQLAREARVRATVEPGARYGNVRNALVRERGENSWDVLGTLASDVQSRRFSDGRQLVFGSDAWLMARQPRITVRQHRGGVDWIDFDWDVGKPAASATVAGSFDRSFVPGLGITVDGCGPADGLWLLESFRRPLTSRQGALSLTRKLPRLVEPRAESASSGELGDLDGLPGVAGSDPGGRGYSATADRALKTTIANLNGDRYLYGAKGPDAWDCSGVTAYYARAGGSSSFNTGSAGQLAACRAAGTLLSVPEGLRTRGAILFDIGGGSGESGNHVAISLGNGKTFEGKGRKYGVGVFDAGRGWTHAARVPGF